MNLPHIHLCIVQPLGYLHSLGFLDQARYFRHQFRRMGAEVTLAKNRLRHGSVNVVFGAHLGFDASLRARYTCLFVNLEQLGAGGAKVSADYLKLLGNSAVADYDRANVGAYTAHGDDVPLFSFGHAPYLDASTTPLAQRPIDLLFIGSMNERRRQLIADVESAGPEGHAAGQPGLRPRARRADRPGEGCSERPLLRECALRTGACLPVPVARHAGDQRALARRRGRRRSSKTACSGSTRPTPAPPSPGS